ncbi:MAG: DegV family protein, partial [Oscillospiraceae bacterium]
METRNYVISTETTCDMETSYYLENQINLMGLTYSINGIEYDSAREDNLSISEFYRQVRDGAMTKTAQVSMEKATASFEKLVQQGNDVFHLSFSSALSGTYQSCCIAAK